MLYDCQQVSSRLLSGPTPWVSESCWCAGVAPPCSHPAARVPTPSLSCLAPPPSHPATPHGTTPHGTTPHGTTPHGLRYNSEDDYQNSWTDWVVLNPDRVDLRLYTFLQACFQASASRLCLSCIATRVERPERDPSEITTRSPQGLLAVAAVRLRHSCIVVAS